MNIIDNFLPNSTYEQIKETMIGSSCSFPWYYFDHMVDKNQSNTTNKFDFQFVHIFFHDGCVRSNYFDAIITPFLQLIKPLAIVRIKANLIPVTDKIFQQKYHIDINQIQDQKYNGNRHSTSIFYLNTNNGKTLFMDGSKINSVGNRLSTFSGDVFHAGTSCTDEKVRCVINFNYVV